MPSSVEWLRNHLWTGLDLAALNIQRGRDHGLPGYNFYRAICNLTHADDFSGLRREIPVPIIERLQQTYDHVDDIDLFPGMIQWHTHRLIKLILMMMYSSSCLRWPCWDSTAWWVGGANFCLHHWHSVSKPSQMWSLLVWEWQPAHQVHRVPTGRDPKGKCSTTCKLTSSSS